VKELQARWQANAKTVVLAQRDERALWEKFRGACNAVFDARTGSRKAAEERGKVQRRALEALCEKLEELAKSSGGDEAQVRSSRHELQEQWKTAIAESGAAPAALEARFRAALAQVEDSLRGRNRASEAAVWQTLFAKEKLCEELDALALAEGDMDPAVAESVRERWTALSPLVPEWERKMLERRDAALKALADADARFDHADRVRDCAAERRDALLELELMLGIESPADLQPHRLAVQVKQLRDRFKRAAPGRADNVLLLLNWCASPGVAEERDRQRCERIVASLQRRR